MCQQAENWSTKNGRQNGVLMNKRHLYKAKRVDNKEWVIGSYIYIPKSGDEKNGHHFIVADALEECYEVFPSTVCQCTGIRSGKFEYIWESDIVIAEYCKDEIRHEFTGYVKYNHFGKFIVQSVKDISFCTDLDTVYDIIGNSFDNPEYL